MLTLMACIAYLAAEAASVLACVDRQGRVIPIPDSMTTPSA